MTIFFQPMSESNFLAYVEESVACYARDLVLGKIATEESAPEKLRSDIRRMLPIGASTPDNFLLEIREERLDQAVGYFWYLIQFKMGERIGFICDILIKPKFRRQGYAKQALKMFEERMKEAEVFQIGLHVFGHNQSALRLYEKFGFEPTSIQMRKSLVQGIALNSSLNTDVNQR